MQDLNYAERIFHYPFITPLVTKEISGVTQKTFFLKDCFILSCMKFRKYQRQIQLDLIVSSQSVGTVRERHSTRA